MERYLAEMVRAPEWPKERPTAAALIYYAAGWGAFLNGIAWGFVERGAFDGDEVTHLKYLRATAQMQHMHDLVLLLKALLDHAPARADEIAADVWSAADAGDSYGESLWGWCRDAGLDGNALYFTGRSRALESDESAAPFRRGPGVMAAEMWSWDWFDTSPNGETYGVRCGDEVVCYTNRFKKGYEDAKRIAEEHNAALSHSDEKGSV